MTTKVRRTRPGSALNLRDRLSRLTFREATQLLGPRGKELIQRNSQTWDLPPQECAYLGGDLFRVRFPETGANGQAIVVSITLMPDAQRRLHWNCTACDTACDHVGAVFSMLLEDKSALGLAVAPEPGAPLESLGEKELIARAIAEREERAKSEPMTVVSQDSTRPWTDYVVTNRQTGKSYRVALRGTEPGQSYCSCPDYRTNTLGTCKHVLHVLQKVKRRFTAAQLKKPYQRKHLALHLDYRGEVSLRLLTPASVAPDVENVVGPLRDRAIDDVHDLVQRLGRLRKLGHDVTIYPDAEEFIQQRLHQERMRTRCAEIRRDPAAHPLRTSLLKTPLLPYQLDGVAFAAAAGRSVLADDMGLGKTIQGVGVAELLARESGIKKVLVVCPASLKSQWRAEIHRFCERSVQLVSGPTRERHGQYANEAFFTICNYEQVLRDLLAIEPCPWDLIILDEGQRIKNWESKTAAVIKRLRSRFALVLSGTPLENRLDELYSVVQFIDDRRLGPGFRFFNRHRVVDEKGRVLGYKNLSELRETLKPVLLRRTRESVRLELPPRTTEFIRIPPTEEQSAMHDGHMRSAVAITRKKYLTEMDLLRLQRELLMCRMAADSTFLVDKEAPGYSSKLEHLDDLIERLFEEQGRKVVLFSEWTTMLDLIEPLLKRRKLRFVRLDGSVPQKQRADLVHQFQHDADCKLFLTTNAGSTGLNLQAANTVINVDLPWNPAVLEQRIARAHRMGQRQPVQVFVLVTEGTLEERLLATLAAKKELALAALDAESETDFVELSSGMEELKRRLEVLLGAKEEAPVDLSAQETVLETQATFSDERRDRVAAAGGELLGAAFKFLGELVSQQQGVAPPEQLVADLRRGLDGCVEEPAGERPRLTITLPDRGALDHLAQTLAKLLVAGAPTS